MVVQTIKFRDRYGRSLLGPCHGERGLLTQIGRKIQCHICGKAFHHLGNHVVRTHELTADEYCDEFGLKHTTGLVSDALAEKMRRNCTLPSLPAEVQTANRLAARSARTRTTRPNGISLEERLSPGYYDRKNRAIRAALAAVKKGREDGTYRQSFNITKEDAKRGLAIRRELDAADPERIERWKQKLSAAKGGITLIDTPPCIVCGKPWTRAKRSQRRTCSPECHEARQKQQVTAMHTPQSRAKISKAAKRRVITRDANGRILGFRV